MTGEEAGLRERYRSDGFLVLPALLDQAAVSSARLHLDGLRHQRPQASGILAVPVDRSGRPCDPWLAEAVTDPRLVGLAQVALGGPVICFGCSYMVKPARAGPAALWHQDGDPWAQRLGITRAVTLWAALDDVDESNGAMRVVTGSHTHPAHPIVAVDGRDGGFFGGGLHPSLVAEVVDPSAVRLLDMAAGDVSAHHPCLVHESGPNRTGRDRRALVVRYRPA